MLSCDCICCLVYLVMSIIIGKYLVFFLWYFLFCIGFATLQLFPLWVSVNSILFFCFPYIYLTSICMFFDSPLNISS